MAAPPSGRIALKLVSRPSANQKGDVKEKKQLLNSEGGEFL